MSSSRRPSDTGVWGPPTSVCGPKRLTTSFPSEDKPPAPSAEGLSPASRIASEPLNVNLPAVTQAPRNLRAASFARSLARRQRPPTPNLPGPLPDPSSPRKPLSDFITQTHVRSRTDASTRQTQPLLTHKHKRPLPQTQTRTHTNTNASHPRRSFPPARQ